MKEQLVCECDLNHDHKIWRTFASNFSKNYEWLQKLYQTLQSGFTFN